MNATPKAPAIDNLLTALTGRDRQASVANNVCATCGGPAEEFRDELSRREFRISGMCQKCQDATFGE